MPIEFQQLFNKQEERFFEKCQSKVEACENIIKVQRENKEKLMNGIKKLWSQKEKEDQNKEDVTKLIEEKFNQLEKRLTSIKKILRTCQTVCCSYKRSKCSA